MRAVGALAVLTTHVSFWAGAYTGNGVWGSLLARLDVGVAIFFVLSGFLLSRPWIVAAQMHTARPGVGRYFWKRFLRIFPVYIVTAVIALSFLHENRGLGIGHWLTTLSLSDIYVRDVLPAGLTQMWSLATEVAFYVVLPLLMLVGVGRRQLRPARLLALLAAMVATSVLWLGKLAYEVPGAEHRAVNEWLPAFLGWFAVGIGLALLHRLHESGTAPAVVSRVVDRISSSPGSCWTAAGGLMLVAATPVAGPTLLVAPSPSEAVTKNLLYAGIGGLLVFTGVFATGAPGYARVMSHRFLRHLGHISYGVFCIHLPVLHFVMWSTGYRLFDGHLVQIFGLTLLLSLLAAEVLYRLVELPCQRLKDLGRRSAASTTATDTAATTR
jgi:peptidoglycan/LPS O-acetylase OafA/YrhL